MRRDLVQPSFGILVALATALALTAAVVSSADEVDAKGRPGMHHLSVSGRVLDDIGVPLQDARVMLKSGSSEGVSLAETVTDDLGRFTFGDISSREPVMGIIEPPAEWLPEYFLPEGVSGSKSDIGDIHLSLNTSISLLLEIVEGETASGEIEHISVVLDQTDQGGGRIVAHQEGRVYLLDQIRIDKGRLEVTLNHDAGFEVYQTEVEIELGRRDIGIAARVPRDKIETVAGGFVRGALEVATFIAPPPPEEGWFLAGTLRRPDGTPFEGAIVSIDDSFFSPWQVSSATIAADGQFRLKVFESFCPTLEVSYGGVGTHTLGAEWNRRDCQLEELVSNPVEVTADGAIPLEITSTGLPSGAEAGLSVRWWHPQKGWQRLHSLADWVMAPSRSNEAFLLADAPGYLPLTVRLRTSETAEDGSLEQTESLAHRFEFDSEVERTLVVSSSAQPIAGAQIDLEQIEDIRVDRRSPLASYRTDSTGRLSLAGPSEGIYEVFVYAEGYDPARAIWNPGTTQVDLVPRDARIEVTGCRRGQELLVKRAGTEGLAGRLRVLENEPVAVAVSPGDYDITALDETGHVITGLRVQARGDEVSRISLDQDDRPVLRFEFPPDEEWSAAPSRTGVSGQAFGYAIYSVTDDAFRDDIEPVAQFEESGAGFLAWRLTGTGKHKIVCSREGLPYTFSRTIRASPGDKIVISAPVLGATLAGSMQTYGGGEGYSHHGWAGPRMWLRAVGAEGWDVTLQMPRRLAEGRFLLENLPSGEYHVHQHLIGTTHRLDSEGETREYTGPVHAWGGIPVSLESDAVVELKDFAEYPYADLVVRLTGARGTPLSNATLAIRDQMSDAWQQVATGPTTLKYASDPIPVPPAVRVVNGSATLPNIRAGRLELELVTDSGRVYRFTEDVAPPEAVEIELQTEP